MQLNYIANLTNSLPEREHNSAFSTSSIYFCLVRTSTCIKTMTDKNARFV